MNANESKDETISRILVEKGVLTENQAEKIMKLPLPNDSYARDEERGV